MSSKRMAAPTPCRLCLDVDYDNIDIFGEEGQKRCLAQKIWKHLGIWQVAMRRATNKRRVDKSVVIYMLSREIGHTIQTGTRVLTWLTNTLHTVAPGDTQPKSICQHCTAQIEYFSCFCCKAEEIQQRMVNEREDFGERSRMNSPRDVLDIKVELDPSIISGNAESNVQSDSAEEVESEACNGLLKNMIRAVLEEEEERDETWDAEDEEENWDTHEEEENWYSHEEEENWDSHEEDNADEEKPENWDSEEEGGNDTKKEGDAEDKGMAEADSGGGASDNSQTASQVDNAPQVETLCQNESALHSNNADEDMETTEEGHEVTDSEMKCSSTSDVQLSSFYKFSCELCKNGETFEKYELLDKHCRSEHKTKGVVVCCGQEISGEYHLKRHMHKHLQLFKCQECGKELTSQWNLTRHMMSKHVPDEKRPFKCKECSKGFATRNHLQLHEDHHQSHSQKLAYVCDTCGKRYSNPNVLHHHQLYQHEKQHSAMCHFCAKTFPTPSTLRRHLETHDTSSYRHSCPVCGKVLKNKDTLRSHMKLHSGKKFPCSQCDKVFALAPKLRDHLRCHSSLRPYECLVCKKSFKRKIALTEHMVQHTGERPHKCPHCPRTFASRANYHTHKRRMHSFNKATVVSSSK